MKKLLVKHKWLVVFALFWIVSIIVVSTWQYHKPITEKSACINEELKHEAISSDLIKCLCEEQGGTVVQEVYTEEDFFLLACGLPL